MTYPDISAALARERVNTLLAEAEAARRARQARRYRQAERASGTRTTPLHRLPPWLQPGLSLRLGRLPSLAAEGTPAVLRDGSTVLIRPVRSTDAPLLADGFARLSPQSRRMRFLGAKTTLSAAELRYFTEVDHHDHEAISALSAADGRGVGIARYVRAADDPQAAEIAVTIVDDWQGRGWAPSCSPNCPTEPGRPASTGSPRWSPPTTPRWPGCCGTWAPAWPAAVPARWNTRSH